MSVLMIDVGGSNIKVMASHDGEMRKFLSSRTMKAQEMVDGVKEITKDWEYDKVSIGFPGLLHNGKPIREPLNLGGDWVNFDFAAAFDRPLRMINDAAMQALGNYKKGRLLFFGLGTSVGTTLIADDVVMPIEIGMVKLTRNSRFMDRLSKAALKKDGEEKWLEAVHEAVALLQDVFYPEDTVLGGGNAKLVDPLPEKCRQTGNRSAYIGAVRLWEGADLFASSCPSTWRIHRNEAHAD